MGENLEMFYIHKTSNILIKLSIEFLEKPWKSVKVTLSR